MSGGELVWHTDWAQARVEAQAKHRLVFALFACARPSALSDQLLHPTDSDLVRLLQNRFVPLRFSSLKHVDLNLFRFDYDLALAGLVMMPQGDILSRWGGEGASVRQLVNLLGRVQERHLAEPHRSAPQELTQKYPRYASQKPASQSCFHCHYAHDAEILEQAQRGNFTKAMLFRYPPVSVLGFTLDPTSGNRVTRVVARSIAARAGLSLGDLVISTNGMPTYTEADIRFSLDRLTDMGSAVVLLVERGKKTHTLNLTPPSGWRVYDISWRPSQGAIPPILGFWEEPLPGSRLALRVSILFPGEKWKASQGELQLGDVIVAVDGKTLPAMSAQQFHSWFRLNKTVGESALFTVLREGKRKEIRVPCLDLRLD